MNAEIRNQLDDLSSRLGCGIANLSYIVMAAEGADEINTELANAFHCCFFYFDSIDRELQQLVQTVFAIARKEAAQ